MVFHGHLKSEEFPFLVIMTSYEEIFRIISPSVVVTSQEEPGNNKIRFSRKFNIAIVNLRVKWRLLI